MHKLAYLADMIERNVGNRVLELSREYPVVTIQGPRQSGKTTLCRALFPDKEYVNLEDPSLRGAALSDPNGFLQRFPSGAVIDEVQRAPVLLSSIQVAVDNAPRAKGLFILTGSAQLQMLEAVTQSLAGRTALVTLLALTLDELISSGENKKLEEYLYSGFYPRIFNEQLNPSDMIKFYVNTYVERDVRQVLNVRDILRFETFLRLCAGRTAQLLNASSLGEDAGINHNTAVSWLSVLESSFLAFRALPFHPKLVKRFVKSPKLFFTDVGLVSYLLGIESAKQIATHPLRGAIFETFVAGEILKQRLNEVKDGRLFFYRDSNGREVDLVIELAGKLLAIEVKASSTFHQDYLKGLHHFASLKHERPVEKILVYAGEKSFESAGCRVLSYLELGSLRGLA